MIASGKMMGMQLVGIHKQNVTIYLYSKIGATNFSEADFAPSLAGCGPAEEFLLLAMALKMA